MRPRPASSSRAGPQRLRVEAPGYLPWEEEVPLHARRAKTINARLLEAPPPQVEAPPLNPWP